MITFAFPPDLFVVSKLKNLKYIKSFAERYKNMTAQLKEYDF